MELCMEVDKAVISIDGKPFKEVDAEFDTEKQEIKFKESFKIDAKHGTNVEITFFNKGKEVEGIVHGFSFGFENFEDLESSNVEIEGFSFSVENKR